jgi:hypothetical protein
MKYAIEMGSSSTIYILSFIKIGSGIQKLIGWRFTDSQLGDVYPCFNFLAYFPKIGLCYLNAVCVVCICGGRNPLNIDAKIKTLIKLIFYLHGLGSLNCLHSEL